MAQPAAADKPAQGQHPRSDDGQARVQRANRRECGVPRPLDLGEQAQGLNRGPLLSNGEWNSDWAGIA